MSTYKILSDTSCDIPAAVLEQLDVTYVPFHVSFDTVNYLKELQVLPPMNFTIKSMPISSIQKPLLPSVQVNMVPWSPF